MRMLIMCVVELEEFLLSYCKVNQVTLASD